MDIKRQTHRRCEFRGYNLLIDNSASLRQKRLCVLSILIVPLKSPKQKLLVASAAFLDEKFPASSGKITLIFPRVKIGEWELPAHDKTLMFASEDIYNYTAIE